MNHFDELRFAFKEHLKVKHYAHGTIDAYTQHLGSLFVYLDAHGITDVKRVTREMLKHYQLTLVEHRDAQGARYTIATLSVKVRAVKRFFEYLESTNQVLLNPAEFLKEPPKERRLPRTVLSNTEVRRILDQPNLSTRTGIRNRTILEVFYSTGIRLAELVHLTLYDCDLQGGLLRVTKGKGGKDRVIPLGRHAVRFLKEYLAHVRPRHTTTNKVIRTLFVNQSGAPLSKPVIQIMVRTSARKAGITKPVTPHVFRHTFATGLVKNGAEITAVQKMLGHSSLKVTQQYSRVAGLEVKQTHVKHHPREQDRVRDEVQTASGRFTRVRDSRDLP